MKPSNNIIKFIREEEGFSPDAYIPIPGDRPTIGYGSTFYKDGTPVRLGDIISLAEAVDLLTIKLNTLAQKLSQITSPKCTQNQFDAVLSLCYNVGLSAFANSTTGTLYSSGQNIADRLVMWNKSNGRVISGLTRRRLREKEIYVNNNYTN